ncbi:MAG TPA: TlpA disulfide reductase family protein [Actinomycetota bacterium]|jgi:cytochrome c biogenesis protein CcmG/thiol:disulfide interchange protein DsbE
MDPEGAARRRRGRWMLLGGVVATVGLLTALFAFGLDRDPTAIGSVLVGRPAPEFTLQTLDGSHTMSMASMRGQVVVVNFWSSWCAECRVEQPALSEAWSRFRDQGVVFVGIAFEDQIGPATRFASAYGLRWPLLADPGSRTAVAFGLSGVPETYVIGPDGTIAMAFKRAVTYADLSRAITRALPGSAA